MSLNEQLSTTSSVSTIDTHENIQEDMQIDTQINNRKKSGPKPKKIWEHFIEGERSLKGHALAISFECSEDFLSISTKIKQEWMQIIATRNESILDNSELIQIPYK
ncbi:3137_t:CDS:2, partial [Dentiscutata erythropus]